MSETFVYAVVDMFYGQVYQEYIHDRHHTHMNSTQWETLTDFVKWLGKEGHCVVDETEKGWFIQYVDRDPETIRRQDALQKKEKMDMMMRKDGHVLYSRKIPQGFGHGEPCVHGNPATE